ncbi:universal stress protein [Fulvivirga lutea]|uniref:Universal stress protein n=1 Tax=Fulvivirga lutea TaxID=2810512 RepID=A0A974WG63_9BACT|nr:universal stress protein [Fulvivirga lutea]QSE96547.1 universal stress protein [Fulvivirga lutea]
MIKILLPTDFSQSARDAALFAIDICKQVGASITFIHLTGSPGGHKQSKSEEPGDAVDTNALAQLQELNEMAQSYKLESDYVIKNESNLDYIKDYASLHKYDLIVLGYKSSNDNHARKLNSFAKHLVSTSETPVLVLKGHVDKINKAALLSDFNEEYIINEKWINSFISKLKIDLTLACINTPSLFFDSRTIMQRMELFKEHYDTSPDTLIYNDYQFANGIKHLCEDLSLDLIIMNTHGKSRRNFSGNSITSQVVASTNCSVLSLPVGSQ